MVVLGESSSGTTVQTHLSTRPVPALARADGGAGGGPAVILTSPSRSPGRSRVTA